MKCDTGTNMLAIYLILCPEGICKEKDEVAALQSKEALLFLI